MKKTTATLVGCVAALLVAAVPLLAHHSFSAEYDQSKVVTLTGKMIKFEWVNPHSWVHIEVTNPDGSKATWKGETPPVNVLYRNGWTKPMAQEMVDKGEIVTLRGPAAKDGSNHIFSQSLTRQDGQTVLGLSGPPPSN
jgi:hypothetical protein